MVGGTDKVKFVSESFLGRTFSSSECARNICLLFKDTVASGGKLIVIVGT